MTPSNEFNPESRYMSILLVKGSGKGIHVIEAIRWRETVAEDAKASDRLKILGFLVTIPSPTGHGPGANHIFSRQCDLIAQHADAIKKLELKVVKAPALPAVWRDSDNCPLCAVLIGKDKPVTRMRTTLKSPPSSTNEGGCNE